MSEANAQEGETLTHEGITVEKSYELDEFPVPAVMLLVRSEREETATITLRDPLPADVSTENVGLHPNYGEESLSIEDDHVRLEHELAPGEEFTALYGLREVDADELAGTLQTPEPVEVTPPASAASSSEAVQEVIQDDTDDESGDGEESLTLEGSAAEDTDSDDDIETAVTSVEDDTGAESSTDPESDAVADAGTADTAEDGESDAEETVETDTGGEALDDVEGIAAALATELRHGDVAEEDLALLREELDLGTGSTEARIQHLQTEVSDLQAYTDALEEFLDESGPTRELLSDLETTVDRLESDLSETAGQVDEHADAIESVDERLGELSDEVDGLREELADAVSGTVDAEDVDERLEDLESSVEGMSDDLDEVAEIQERLQSVFGGADDN